MILMVCILLMLGTLKTMQNRKVTIDKLKSDTIEELEDSITTLKVSIHNANEILEGGVTRSKYESITTVSSNKVPSDAIDSWDVSEDQNGKIMAWYLDEDNDNMYELYIGQKGGVIANPDSSYLFSALANVTSMDLSSLNTSYVTDMSSMFHGSSGGTKITTLDLSNWDTSNVTNMANMFALTGLVSLDLSNWDTSNVTNMSYMFAASSSLTSLDVSNFDTSNVTNMDGVFSNASGLTSLDLSNWDTSNVTCTRYMFLRTTSLKTLNISGANFTKVTSYGDMFLSSKVSTIYVKDSIARTFINSRLSDAGLSATVTIP